MSIVTDRRCDNCGDIREQRDTDWIAVLPPVWDAEDHRLDFCDARCLHEWAKQPIKRLDEVLLPDSNTGIEPK